MKRITFAIIATMIGALLIKFFWIVTITAICFLLIRFTTKSFKKSKKPKENKVLWQPWSDR